MNYEFLKLASFYFVILLIVSCDLKNDKKSYDNKMANVVSDSNIVDSIMPSKIHQPNVIICDLDGDEKPDSIVIVQNVLNGKYGLKIRFANDEINYLGLGEEVIDQGFDDLIWIGIFEKVPKGTICAPNVDKDGNILLESEIKKESEIKLPNDAIYVHQTESCGGGIIYMEKGVYKWIQQE